MRPAPTNFRRALRLLLAITGATAAACTHDAVSPEIAAPGEQVPRAETEAAYEVFSGIVRSRWTQHVLVADSVWVLVEVQGKVSYSRNPTCFSIDYTGWCDGPATWLEASGPFGPVEAGGEVRVSTSRVGYPGPVEGHSSGAALYSPAGDPRSPVGRLLFRNVVGPQYVWTRLQTYQTYAGNPTNPLRGYFPVYLISGEPGVRVSIVPTPLRIAGPEKVARGQKATFTAEPVGDFRIRDPQGRRFVAWQFLPGDTLEHHNPRSGRVTLPCDSVRCEYEPRQSGRLMAHAYVEGQPVTVTSAVIRVQEAKLELSCPGQPQAAAVRLTLLRGEIFDCSAVISPSRPFTVVEWTYTGGGRTIPAPDAPAFTARRWAGEMVVSGNIAVRVVVGQDTLSATATVTVEARPWVDRIAPPVVKYFSCPGDLTASCPLPEIPVHYHDLGRVDPGPTYWPSLRLYINSGPNAGFGFFPGHESFVNIAQPWISLNAILQNPQHPFWRERPGCDVQRVHDWVVEHEMIHYTGIKELVEAGITPGWLESYTPFGTQAEVWAAFDEILRDYNIAIRNAGDSGHTNPRFAPAPCDLRLLPTRRNPMPPVRSAN